MKLWARIKRKIRIWWRTHILRKATIEIELDNGEWFDITKDAKKPLRRLSPDEMPGFTVED